MRSTVLMFVDICLRSTSRVWKMQCLIKDGVGQCNVSNLFKIISNNCLSITRCWLLGRWFSSRIIRHPADARFSYSRLLGRGLSGIQQMNRFSYSRTIQMYRTYSIHGILCNSVFFISSGARSQTFVKVSIPMWNELFLYNNVWDVISVNILEIESAYFMSETRYWRLKRI